MDRFERYGDLLRTGGTNRLQRMPLALESGYVAPDERGLSQLFAYARAAAAQLRFQSLSGQAAGDWSPLFDPLTNEAGTVLDEAALVALRDASDALPPQLALLFAFFKVFGHVQSDLNALPARHLAHYFEDVLQLSRKPPEPDRVHVVFEPTRAAGPVRIEAGARLDAGKDLAGQPLGYVLEREIVVTQARLAKVRRLVAERDRQGRLRFFKADSRPPEGWPTFGADPFVPQAEADLMTEVDTGFAVSDPVLRLARGVRRVEIAMALSSTGVLPNPQILTTHVRVEFTGAEGWFAPGSASVTLATGAGGLELHLVADLAEGDPAIVDFDQALHGGDAAPAAPWPVMRCLVHSISGLGETLARLTAREVTISVSATGLTDLVLQNDQGTLVPGKPVPLFGPRPTIGSNFYIGSAEIFGKRLTGLTLHLAWQDLPADLFAHYRAYFDLVDAVLEDKFRPSFKAVVDLLDGRSWNHRLTGAFGSMPLFRPGFDFEEISFSETALMSAYDGAPYAADPDMAKPGSYRPGIERGFLRLQLIGPTNLDLSNFGVPYAQEVPFRAFGHDAFAARYAGAALDRARWDGIGTEPVLPNEPYLPTLSALSLDYTSRSAFAPDDVQAVGRFFTLGAFGHTEAGPRVAARLVPPVEGRGALFLGIENPAIPGTLDVLFQLDEGTATVPDPPDPADVAWSYLSGDAWIALPPAAVVVDETRGFQKPGVIAVAIGADATTRHSAMPAGMAWLRATLARPPQAAARTLALELQAATAIFSPGERPLADFADHLATGLSPETIARLTPRRATIRKVRQPYRSFGGRRDEADQAYYERATERLRHRGRAVTSWDFERHLLDRFAGVFKVRCLAHADADANPRVGDAALVILPDLSASQSSNRLEPRAGETLMEDIRSFLRTGITSPFANVHVIHPIFERVRVDAGVAFREGFDPGFYADQLDTDLQRFLSPWAFEEGRDIALGSRIYRSALLKYVEDRPYVDYVTRFDLYHAIDGAPLEGVGFMEIGVDFVVASDPQPAVEAMQIGVDFIVGRPVETAVTTAPHAVLVSHAEHRITPVFPGTGTCSGVAQLGVGYMIVGLDLEVAAP